MKVCMIMDPIQHIHPEKDTTFALLLAAQKKHHPIYYAQIDDLFINGNTPYAHAKKLHVQDTQTHWFDIKKQEILPLTFFDIIFMRKDPPVDQAYLHATQILDFAEQNGVRVYNKPQSLRDYNEKLFVHHFAHLAPETLISSNMMQIRQFIAEHEETICKPLDGMGGVHIFKVSASDPNLSVILEVLTQRNRMQIVCQRYLPAIQQHGDKRLILINGKPAPYGLARMPQNGETRGNLASGGRGHGVELTKNDYKICEAVGSFLKEKGILLAGLDVIGDYLTEINITSPTCVREIENIFHIDIASQILQAATD